MNKQTRDDDISNERKVNVSLKNFDWAAKIKEKNITLVKFHSYIEVVTSEELI